MLDFGSFPPLFYIALRPSVTSCASILLIGFAFRLVRILISRSDGTMISFCFAEQL